MTSKTEITDEFLIHLFKLNKKDIICLEKYKKSGEGKLTLEKIKEFESFKITDKAGQTSCTNCLSATQIKYIQKIKLQSPRKTRKKKPVKSTKTRKKTIKLSSKTTIKTDKKTTRKKKPSKSTKTRKNKK